MGWDSQIIRAPLQLYENPSFRRRKIHQEEKAVTRMRWLVDPKDMSLSKLREIVKDREA